MMPGACGLHPAFESRKPSMIGYQGKFIAGKCPYVRREKNAPGAPPLTTTGSNDEN